MSRACRKVWRWRHLRRLAGLGAGLVPVATTKTTVCNRLFASRTHREELMRFPVLWVSAALVALAAPAVAQDKPVQLKLSHWVPATHPLQKAMEEWGASVEKASNGTIKSTVYPAQQLGKAFDHYDMARDGIADFTYVNPGSQRGRFPIIAPGEWRFLG